MTQPTASTVLSGKGVPAEVGLIGLGYYTQSIIDLCQASGIKVAFVVDDGPEDRPGYHPGSVTLSGLRRSIQRARIPLWTYGAFIRCLEQKASLPVLLASRIENQLGTSTSADAYLRHARTVRELSGRRLQLYHPVTLGEVIDLPPYRQRVALFGFQGAGNILAQHILGDLAGKRKDPVPTNQHLMACFAEHYFVSTTILLQHLLAYLEPRDIGFNPSEYPTMDLSLSLPGQKSFAYIMHVPSNRHYAQFFYHTHAMPTQVAIDELTRLGAACIAIIRHPCETMLSMASKLSRPPSPVLDDPYWMEFTLHKFAEWNRQLIANKDRITVVRYEDLILRDRRPVQEMADRLGVTVTDSEVDALFDRYLHRDLLPGIHPGHYYRSGTDKWKKWFLPRHVRRMLAYGFEPMCRQWSYEVPSQAACARQDELYPREEWGDSGQVFGALKSEDLRSMGDRHFTREPIPYLIRATNSDLRRGVVTQLLGPEFLDHLNNGGIGPAVPPWVKQIPWEQLGRTLQPEFFVEVPQTETVLRKAA